MYTWGIFLAYIRRRLVSRLRSSVFWEAGRDRVILVSEPRFSTCDVEFLLLFRKGDLVLTGYLRQVTFTLQYTYTILLIILTPFGIDRPSFGNSHL